MSEPQLVNQESAIYSAFDDSIWRRQSAAAHMDCGRESGAVTHTPSGDMSDKSP